MPLTLPHDPLDVTSSRQLHRALTAGKEELFAVVADAPEQVLRAALRNPALDEEHLLALLKRRDLSEDFLAVLHRVPAVTESQRLKIALVRNPGAPARVVLSLLPFLYLFDLVAICQFPGATPDLKLAAERAVIGRLSVTPLGNKMAVARRGTAAILDAIMKEGDPRLVEVCLANPHLKESSVFQLVSGRGANAEAIGLVARHPRWCGRPNICQALLKNPKTPSASFTSVLATAPLADLKTLTVSGGIPEPRRKALREELQRRGGGSTTGRMR